MRKTLTVNFLSFWHAGSGMPGSAKADTLVEKDPNRLPYLPGRALKGLLRDAMLRAEHFGWLAEYAVESGCSLTELVFGSSQNESAGVDRDTTIPGLIKVGDGRLPKQELAWITAQIRQGRSLARHFYREIHSTAINRETGTARDGSLRGLQVTVPLQLQSELAVEASPSNHEYRAAQGQVQAQVYAMLALALPLIEGAGGSRNRGYGRVQMELQS